MYIIVIYIYIYIKQCLSSQCQINQYLSNEQMSGLNGRTFSICHKEQKCQTLIRENVP
jgi:hypothetical protein